MPGDFPHAFAIWGTKCGADSAGCDGDSDGLIKWNHLSNNDCPNQQEPLHAWQHMNLDSIIEGKFTGVCSGSGYGLDDSYNSKLGGNAIWIVQLGMYSLAMDNTQILSLTNGGGVDYGDDWAPILTPTEAQNIDSKIDDGLPLTGLIIATEGFASANTCKTGTGNQYVLTQPVPSCVLGNIIYNVN